MKRQWPYKSLEKFRDGLPNGARPPRIHRYGTNIEQERLNRALLHQHEPIWDKEVTWPILCTTFVVPAGGTLLNQRLPGVPAPGATWLFINASTGDMTGVADGTFNSMMFMLVGPYPGNGRPFHISQGMEIRVPEGIEFINFDNRDAENWSVETLYGQHPLHAAPRIHAFQLGSTFGPFVPSVL